MATRDATVSYASPLDAKEQVKQAIDIVELVERYVRLRRQGRNYVGLCPWHDDSRPSLQVNPERQSFKCWVCDIGGDVFSFVMKIEGVEFREALEMLADRAGVALKPAPVRQGPAGEAGGEAVDKRTLYQAMAWAEKQYQQCLAQSPAAEPARRYLDERGITAESIERFHVGFAPSDWDWILKQAGGSPSRASVLEAAGVLVRSAGGGNHYDRFRGRLLFSIRDAQGRPVGFGGRVLPEVASVGQGKYVNSPETPLFSKSRLLYGLDLARESIRRSRTALVMEGYTDVIMAHQHGFDNAVAVLGTALGEGHVRLLRRFADRIVLVLDGDEAGQRRAGEVLDLFVAQQVDLRIVTLPAGKDPCELLREDGPETMRELLEAGAVDALDHAFRTATRGLDLERDLPGVDRALEQLLSVIAKAPRLGSASDAQQRNREWKLLSTLALRFRVPEESLRARLRELRVRMRRAAGGPGRQPAAPPAAKLDPCCRELLELLVAYPERLAPARQAIRAEWLKHEAARQIFETWCRLADAGTVPAFDRLMLELDDAGVKSLLVELDEASQAKGCGEPSPEALLDQLVKTFQRRELERQRPQQLGALREGDLDASQETALLEAIIRQERDRQGISGPTDGSGCPESG